MNESNNTLKRKRLPTKGSWKPGCVPHNPAGAPKRGESWKEVLKYVGKLSTSEVSEFIQRKSTNSAKLHAALVMYRNLYNKGESKLFKELADRAEGKVSDKLEVEDKTPTKFIFVVEDKAGENVGSQNQAPQSPA